ncbi:hypothetical protein BCR35DRAFT_352901 [Leucosporidium creatinivorum]|uniref:PUB domain-containing protein n=1 Tax=Leucosporidium creatinivorum TaxID=106004 RepID=A0A1Y2F3X5_9BASI|nr:hypothetical protein BCR35DRAFT_352901 [Leucosporidium creatinivorum]
MDPPPTAPGALPTAQQPTSALTPVQAARLAAERRATAPPPLVHSASSDSHKKDFDPATFDPSAKEKLPFHRLLDAELLPKCSKPQAVKTLEMLLQVTGNVLDPPNPTAAPKYRQLRLSNSQVVRNIVDVPGAFDYLIACGWHRTVVEYVAYLNFSSAPSSKQLHLLRTGNFVLKQVVQRAREAEEREKRYRESEKEAEKQRSGRALLQFEEDRRLRKEKDEREKIVRDARAAATAAAAAAPPPPDPHSVDADHPLFTQDASAATMDVDRAHGDLPPSYGASLLAAGSGGRVLGTGAVVGGPPPGVRMVSRQDMESDYEEEEGEEEEDY